MSQRYYVGVGASAGGLEALECLFHYMPEDSGLTFIVVQHLSPDFKSLMDELLARHTKMPITVAEDGMITEENHLYLIPPRMNVSIFNGTLLLEKQVADHQLHLPIDIFFKSLALDQKKQAIAIVLSGTGSDGMLGVRAIKERGGLVLVQKESEAKFDGMPRSSISTGLVDGILPAKEMGKTLMAYIAQPSLKVMVENQRESKHLDVLAKIGLLMRHHDGVDFTMYKDATILRRIERRMHMHKCDTLDEYLSLLRQSTEERNILQRECLIGVTSFFRDKEAFDMVKTKVIPHLPYYKNKVRIWSAGCSTGEEVYSVAILIQEYLRENNLQTDVKIFATDIDERALTIAGTGYYPESLMADIDLKYMARYFEKKDDGYQISSEIRKMIVFAKHNLIKDPPFSRLDFLICRNVFIYLKSTIQEKVLNQFYNALHPEGMLFLGSSESLGEVSQGFQVIDNKWKIYQCVIGYRPDIASSLLADLAPSRQSIVKYDDKLTRQKTKMEPILTEAVSLLSPPSIIINQHDQIVHAIADVSIFMKVQPGRFSNNFNHHMNKDQALFIHNIIRRLKANQQEVIIRHLSGFLTNELITLHGRILRVEAAVYYVISFIIEQDESSTFDITEIDMSEEIKARVDQLEHELQVAREGLQATIEELETSNEELQSSNEELIASNEELQSTNEELQSVNEELYTVNHEHQEKITQLTDLNNDLNNLIKNTDIGALYLDQQLIIRKITPVVSSITNIRISDIGRPINHIAVNKGYPTLVADAESVVKDLASIEREIQLDDGLYYLARIRPYRTEYNAAEGILITFVEISRLKNEEKHVFQAKRRLDHALTTGEMAWWEYDIPTGHVTYSDSMADLIGYAVNEFPNDITEIMKLIHPNDFDPTIDAMHKHLKEGTKEWNVLYRIKRKDGSYALHHNRGKVIARNKVEEPLKMMGTLHDLSNFKSIIKLNQNVEKE